MYEFEVSVSSVATLGDQLGDVRRHATHVTSSDEDEGFAEATERFTFPRVAARPARAPAG